MPEIRLLGGIRGPVGIPDLAPVPLGVHLPRELAGEHAVRLIGDHWPKKRWMASFGSGVGAMQYASGSGLPRPPRSWWRTGRLRRMDPGTARRPVAFGLARHPPLPAPEAQRRTKVLHCEDFGHQHRLPRGVIMIFRQPDDQSLGRGHPSARGRVPVGDVLEEGLWVDRLATLPIEDCQYVADARVQVKRAGVAADLAVYRPFDGQRFEGDALRPVFPALHRPSRGIR